MQEIGGKKMIQWQMETLAENDIKKVFVCLGEGDNLTSDFLGDGSKYGVPVIYLRENEPLGSAGPLFLLANKKCADVLFVPGDCFFDIDMSRYLSFFHKSEAMVCPHIHPCPHPEKENVLLLGEGNRALAVLPKEKETDFFYKNLVPSGLCILSKEMVETFEGEDEPFAMDFFEEVLSPAVAVEAAACYQSSEYVHRLLSKDDLVSLEKDIARNKPKNRNLRRPQKAIFLDRDGTINVFGDFVRTADMLTLFDDAPAAIKEINDSDYLAIVASNQPIVARGETTLSELHNIFNKMEDLLGEKGAYLDGVFFCPHFPSRGHPNENHEFSKVCECRKPGIGMLLEAKKRYNLDLSQCWFVGDTYKDMLTGQNAGCHTALLLCGDPRTKEETSSAVPEKICHSLSEAIKAILG